MSALVEINQLLQQAEKEALYEALIIQLNKDFNLSNIAVALPNDILPEVLKQQLYETIHQLISDDFDAFLNLLYRVDVPQKALSSANKESLERFSAQATLAILKREWQKVWFRKTLG